MTPSIKIAGTLMCGAAAAVLLSGCKPGAQQAAAADAPPPLAALPLTNASTSQGQPGPVAVDLPNAPPARLGPAVPPGDDYAYLDRAYFLNDAFGDAPPDYGFSYADDETPWVWETDDGYFRVAEFLPYGVRYYYFGPGYDYPFLIRDPDYAYAFAGGDLVGIYDTNDDFLPPEDLELHAPIAGREFSRAVAMFRESGRNRQAVPLASWTNRRGQIASNLANWRQLESRQSAWRSYHQAHLGPEQAHWAPETFRRAAETARVDGQLHDPDGAQHALAQVGRAQDIARKAHVQLAMLPRGQGTAAARPGTRLAMNQAVPGRAGHETGLARLTAPDETSSPARGLRIERPSPSQMAATERAAPQRLAMAGGGPNARAMYDVRGHDADHGPTAFAGPRQRAAAPDRAPARSEPAFARAAPSHATANFARPAQAPRVQVAQARPSFSPHGGGGHGGGPSFSRPANGGGNGGHPGGGGGHGGGQPKPQKAPDKHH